eukprot:1139765-Pelagomonas_calceolata.AAC.3
MRQPTQTSKLTGTTAELSEQASEGGTFKLVFTYMNEPTPLPCSTQSAPSPLLAHTGHGLHAPACRTRRKTEVKTQWNIKQASKDSEGCMYAWME